MAKRLTDSNKSKDVFWRNLPPFYKLFWDFICNECDHAGLWEVDLEWANLILFGQDEFRIEKKEAFKLFNKDKIRIVEIENGKYWYIPGFIVFQYGGIESLNPNNRVHLSVINILEKKKLLKKKFKNIVKKDKPLVSPSEGTKDKDKDKDKNKYKDKDKEKKEMSKADILINIVKNKLKMIVKNKKEFQSIIDMHGEIAIGQAIGRMVRYWNEVNEHKYKQFVFAKRWNKMTENIEVFLSDEALEDKLAMLAEKNKQIEGSIANKKAMKEDQIKQIEDYIQFLKDEGDQEEELQEAREKLKLWKKELKEIK